MRAVLQRVTSASVEVDGKVVSSIGPGLLCLVGIHDEDTERDAEFVAKKVLNLRLWSNTDTGRAWDESVSQRGHDVLCVSQFTLYARLRKGTRPDFQKAMGPERARELYGRFLERLRSDYAPERVHDGVFGAMMSVSSVNAGPVTLTVDSRCETGGGGN